MTTKILGWGLLACALMLAAPASVRAHCDALDGPVVKAAQKALDTKNAALVLIWVLPQDEAQIRASFDETVKVRALSAEARALTDRYFFETVVRVHRAGEGAAYTGLKPAGQDMGPAIRAADTALEQQSVTPLLTLVAHMDKSLREHFREATATATFDPADVEAGRRHVKAYVEFLHLVERLYEAVHAAPHAR